MTTVLCIDDNADSLIVRKCILGKEGYSVLTADNGSDGLRALAENPVDVVVLDYRMPEMDGLAVAREICQRDESPFIVLLTGSRRRKSLRSWCEWYMHSWVKVRIPKSCSANYSRSQA